MRDDGIIDRQISNRTHATGIIFQKALPKYLNAMLQNTIVTLLLPFEGGHVATCNF